MACFNLKDAMGLKSGTIREGGLRKRRKRRRRKRIKPKMMNEIIMMRPSQKEAENGFASREYIFNFWGQRLLLLFLLLLVLLLLLLFFFFLFLFFLLLLLRLSNLIKYE